MRNYILYIIGIFFCLLFLEACHNEEWTECPDTEGRVTYRFQGSLMEEQKVVTRAIDPDGKTVRTFWLFCFDENGLFLERSKATADVIDGETTTIGTFAADIPAITGVVHYLANVNLGNFEDRNYVGTTESYVISPLVSTSGRLTYWGRGTVTVNGTTVTPSSNPVVLYRGQAVISAVSSTSNFTVEGMSVCNKWLSGTVAPFNANASTDALRFGWTPDAPFITYHGSMQKQIDPTEVTAGNMEEFVFEHDNTSDDPLCVILKGYSNSGSGDFYYKVQLVDANKHFYTIYRNYRYKITVTGDPGKGYSTFAAAKAAAPVNNPLFNVDPSLPGISVGQQTLSLELGTTLIINEGNVSGTYYYDIPYSYREYTTSGWNDMEATDLEITQNDGFITSADIVGNSKIRLEFSNAPDENMHIGRITIWGGMLSRSVAVYYGKKFQFSPVFMTDKIAEALYINNSNATATLTFTVPESYPAALFPISCRIYAQNLNPMETLSVVQDDNGYGYMQSVAAPGTYTVKFKNISTAQGTEHQKITLRAENFEDVEREFTYVTSLSALSADPPSITLASKKGASSTFTITSGSGELLSVYSRFSKIAVSGISVTETLEDAVSGLKKFQFNATGTSTTVTVTSESSRSVEVLNIAGESSRSTTLSVINSPSNYNFNLLVNPGSVSYLPGSPVILTFQIPSEAWVGGAEYYLYAKNLTAAAGTSGLTANSLGFSYKPVNAGTQTLNFVTNTAASAETVTLLSDASLVSFEEAQVSYTNTPVTGKITYDGQPVLLNSFVAMERGDGLRVGKLTIGNDGGYSLEFYPDYKQKVTDEVIFTYTSGGDTYQCKKTVQELCSGSTGIDLTKT